MIRFTVEHYIIKKEPQPREVVDVDAMLRKLSFLVGQQLLQCLHTEPGHGWCRGLEEYLHESCDHPAQAAKGPYYAPANLDDERWHR